jgi:hypothetical protein
VSKRTNQELSALAAAIAGGESVSAWARRQTPEIPKRAAYTWSRLPQVKRTVAEIRRRAVDRAAGELARGALKAARKIVHLAESAESEAVALAASRAVLSDLRETADWIAFEGRLAELERTVHEKDH